MNRKTIGALALLGAFAIPGSAYAATSAIATANVNLRAGPSTQYPVVDVVYDGDNVRVFGCLSSRSWCDIAYNGQRGWVSSSYLAYLQGGRRYTGPNFVTTVGVPIISFTIGDYWDDYYRGRPFYRNIDRFDRREIRREIRRDRRDDRRDLRDARREVKQERRDVRDARRDLREARRDGDNIRAERRELRQERRELRRAQRERQRERRD